MAPWFIKFVAAKVLIHLGIRYFSKKARTCKGMNPK